MFYTTTATVCAITLGITLTLARCPSAAAEAACPSNSQVCSCRRFLADSFGPNPLYKIDLTCSDLSSQSQFTDFMASVHAVNPDLNINDISITSSKLTSLDLNPVYKNIGTVMNKLSITASPNLQTIANRTANKRSNIRYISLADTAVPNEAVASLLTYCYQSPLELAVNGSPNFKSAQPWSPFISFWRLDFPYNQFQRITLENNQIAELQRGAFEKSTKLTHISLRGNKIKKVSQGALDSPESWTTIDLARNKISKLEKRAFYLSKDKEDGYKIDLAHNELTAESFDEGFIERKGKGHCELNLENNKLKYLPKEVFLKLFASDGAIKKLLVSGNPIVCDDKMEWIWTKGLSTKVNGTECNFKVNTGSATKSRSIFFLVLLNALFCSITSMMGKLQ